MYYQISTWGPNSLGVIGVRVADTDILDSVLRSISRRLGLKVISICEQGYAMYGGDVTGRHYQVTVGRAARGGGYSVSGQFWFSIPVRALKNSAMSIEGDAK